MSGLIPPILALVGGLGDLPAPILPEPPLLLFVLPITALFCYWRPDRRHRVHEPESDPQPQVGPPAPREYPRLPARLK